MKTIGIDLGGTNIRAARCGEDGRIIGSAATAETQAFTLEGEAIYARILSCVKEVMAPDVVAIGIGSTGPLDMDKGMLLDCNNLPSLQYFPLVERLKADTGLPVFMNNDANALVLGEAVYGAGKGASRVLGLTLGTGLGAALVIDGEVVRGATDNAGEIWTSPYKDSIIEDYVSGTGIQNMYKERTGKQLKGKEIYTLGAAGDPDALAVWDAFADALAFAMSWCVNLDDPDVVVLGGSVVKSAPLFMPRANEKLRKFICTSASEHLQVKEAELGGDAGIIGAAYYAKTKYGA